MTHDSRPRFTLLNHSLVDTIIDEAFSVLETVGIFFEHTGAESLLMDHGGKKHEGSGHVLIPRDLIERGLKTSPASFHLFDAAGTKTIVIGGDIVHYDPGSAALKIHDSLRNEQLPAATADLIRFHGLTETLEHFHLQSTGLVSSDVPAAIQDAYRLYIALQFCGKPIVTGLFVEEGFAPMVDMLAAIRGGEPALRAKPLAIFDACPSAPLRWSNLTTTSVVECARCGIPSEFISVPLAGATGPVTLSGSLVQHAAENLAGLAIAQCVTPGSPVVFGGSPAIFDMRSGNTPLGAIESVMLNAGHVQIGKRLGLPTHAYIGLSDAKSPDAQAGLETAVGIVIAALSGINVVSGGGMLDFESCQSLEKLIIDNDICGMAYRLLEGVDQRDSPMALDLLAEVGHQSDFLGLSHTREWYRREQFFPSVLDRGNVEQWRTAGKPTLENRAALRVSELLRDGPLPVISEEKQREMRRVMQAHARKAGMGHLPETEGNQVP